MSHPTTAKADARVATYYRISSDPSGERAGVERQRAEVEELCRREGWTIVATYEDNDRSAWSRKPRPEFEKLLAAVEAGEFDVVVVWATDRLYRRMTDLGRITETLADRAIVRSVKGGDVDLSTAEGKLRANVLGAVAQFESDRKSERVAARARQRLEEGRMTSSARPFGWSWVDPCPGGSECGHKRTCDPSAGTRPRKGSRRGLTPNTSEAVALGDAYRAIADGRSLRSVAAGLAADGWTGSGGRPITAETLRPILLNGRNAGIVSRREEFTDRDGKACQRVIVVREDAAAIVDRELFDAAAAILTDPSRRTSPGRPVATPLGKIARCGKCGGPMAASKKAGVPVYLCSRHKHLSRRRALLDGPILALVRAVLVDLETAGWLAVPAEQDGQVEARARIAAIEDRLGVLAGLVASGDLDPLDYALASKRLRAELADLMASLHARRPALSALTRAESVGDVWDAMGLDDRRAVLFELVEAVEVEPATNSGEPTAADARIVWASWVPDGAPSRPEVPVAPALLDRRARVLELHRQGLSQVAIAAATGHNRGTVRRHLRAAGVL